MAQYAGQIIRASDITERFQSRTESISFTSQTLFIQAVTFDVQFRGTPVVFANIATSAGTAARWDARAYNVTTSGFDLFLFNNDGTTAFTWASTPVMWTAIYLG